VRLDDLVGALERAMIEWFRARGLEARFVPDGPK